MSALRLIDWSDDLSPENVQELLAEKRRLESRISNFIDPQLKKAWARYGSFDGSGYYVRKQMTVDESFKIDVMAEAIVQIMIDPNHKLANEEPELRALIVEVIGRILGSMTDSQLKGSMNRRDNDCLFFHREELEAKMQALDLKDYGRREYNGKPGIVIQKSPPKNQVVFEPPKD